MPLSPADRALNRTKLEEIIKNLVDFYTSKETQDVLENIRARLQDIMIEVFSLLDEENIPLKSEKSLAHLQNIINELLIKNTSLRRLNNIMLKWVEDYRSENSDIHDSLKYHAGVTSWKNGSVRDLEKVFGRLIKTPENADEEVVILTPLSFKEHLSSDQAVQKINADLLSAHIKKVLDKQDNKTRELFVPIQFDGENWRLVIVKVNTKKKKN